MLNSRMAVSLQDAVKGVCTADGDGLGGGQEGVPHQADSARSLMKLGREKMQQ